MGGAHSVTWQCDALPRSLCPLSTRPPGRRCLSAARYLISFSSPPPRLISLFFSQRLLNPQVAVTARLANLSVVRAYVVGAAQLSDQTDASIKERVHSLLQDFFQTAVIPWASALLQCAISADLSLSLRVELLDALHAIAVATVTLAPKDMATVSRPWFF